MKFEKINGHANHHLFRRGSRSIWVRYFKAALGSLEQSLKTDRLELARIRRDEAIAKFTGVAPRWRGQSFLVEDKFPEFIGTKSTKAPRTIQSMKAHWDNHLKPFFGDLRLDEITDTEWIKYVQTKRENTPNRKFFNDRKYLSMFLNWLHRKGLIKQIPRLEDVDPERKAGRAYSDAEILSLLEKAKGDLHLQILMALTMGMRKSEITSLDCDQVDLKHKSIYLPAEKTKIRKARTFAISEDCFEPLRVRVLVRKTGYVFKNRSFEKAWITCREDAEVTGRFHDLRHTFLTKAFKKSVNPALICNYAGLSLEEAEKTYLHFNVEDTRPVAGLVSFL